MSGSGSTPASFQTFCLTARVYLNTQKYGLFCSLDVAIPKKDPSNLVDLLKKSQQTKLQNVSYGENKKES